MATATVTTGLQRAARLIPFRAAGPSRLTGEYGAVCTPAVTVPAELRQGQEDRTAHYLATRGPSARSKPDHAPRYWVTSYGVVIAWVTLDGRTHYADDADLSRGLSHVYPATVRTLIRHRDTIRAAWPGRFAMNSEGDPIYLRNEGGVYGFAPAGSIEWTDAEGFRRVTLPA
jgi:hypothetical protein